MMQRRAALMFRLGEGLMSSTAVSLAGGSPASELSNRALADLNVDKKARDAGVKDLPPPNSNDLDANEREFFTYFSEMLRERRTQCDATLAKHALDRTATSSKIDLIQTRNSLSGLFNAIEPDLTRKRQDHQQDLERAKDQEARSLRFLRHFQQEHGLQNRAADPRPDPLWHFALVAAFAVVEWVALSIFYAEGSDFGLLGGVLMAMALSIINIGLAVFAGAVLRYVNHESPARKALGVLAAVLLTILFLAATGFAAHYRNAARDIASAGEQSQSTPQFGMGQIAKGLQAPRAEDDQWKASKLAWQQYREHWFFFDDVLSWLLVILAIMFGIIAAWKGYGIDDRYPGYGPISREYEQHRAAYEAEKKKYTDTVDGVFSTAGRAQQDLLRNARKDIEYFQDLASKSETQVSQYAQFCQQVAQACNDVLFRYREINRQVATSPAPAYFKRHVSFESGLVQLPEALTDRERSLLEEYKAAIREFTQVVHDDDARRQALRAQHLGKLGEFFDRIERAINEKLAREAQLYRA
jgi:hypothetical protein